MKPWWKEWVDQPLHMLMILDLFLVGHYQLPWYAAAGHAFCWMLLRELEQHKWKWREVGQLDLKFCLLSCALCSIASPYLP